VDVQPFSIFGDYIVTNEIIIDLPEFFYETKSGEYSKWCGQEDRRWHQINLANKPINPP